MVRKVYSSHLKNVDVKFEKIPKGPMQGAMDELKERLPDVFERCEGDWFGVWVLHNRHRGRFRSSKKKKEVEVEVEVGSGMFLTAEGWVLFCFFARLKFGSLQLARGLAPGDMRMC